MEIESHGVDNYKFTKFGDYITITKPQILAKNIIMGQLYIDIAGKVEATNHITGEKAIINCIPRSWKKMSEISGVGIDKSGKVKYEFSGSWLSEVKLKNLETN